MCYFTQLSSIPQDHAGDFSQWRRGSSDRGALADSPRQTRFRFSKTRRGSAATRLPRVKQTSYWNFSLFLQQLKSPIQTGVTFLHRLQGTIFFAQKPEQIGTGEKHQQHFVQNSTSCLWVGSSLTLFGLSVLLQKYAEHKMAQLYRLHFGFQVIQSD